MTGSAKACANEGFSKTEDVRYSGPARAQIIRDKVVIKNLFNYEGKRVVITGASSGMGEATAHLVHQLGAEVIALDVQPPRYDFAHYLDVDLRDCSAIDQAVQEFTSTRVHHLFYCAGLPGAKFPAVDVVTVNFIAQRQMINQLVPHLQPGDAIASVSSGAGMGYAFFGEKMQPFMDITAFDEARDWIRENEKEDWFEPYSFSKMCSIVFTLRAGGTITTETGVRVNCISPGPTDTAMMPAFIEQTSEAFFERFPKPIGRNSTAEEQAWPLAFLNSDAASYISGENIYTDGGASSGVLNGSIDAAMMIPD
jgi:NAD(P)-dependent dehydrogenase (short-subunit alcohol dehydrogenase family)